MRLLKFVIPFLAAGVLASGSAFAGEQHFKTPEEAVTAYINAIKTLDLDAVLATTAVDHLSKDYDFQIQTARLGRVVLSNAMPATDPLFVSINKAANTANIARQVQYLIYGLLIKGDVINGNFVIPPDHPLTAADVYTTLQAKRLAGLTVSMIAIPAPADLNSDHVQSVFQKVAGIFHADARTERVALLSFEGTHYLIGFGLIRYGDDWLVETQMSNLAGNDMLGAPRPISPDDFAAVVR